MRFSHILTILNATALLLFCSGAVFAQKNEWIVVLDAGHGGKDPGAVHGPHTEKSINLNVVLETGRLLSQSKNPRIKVVYTRSTDKFVELSQRSRIANNARADLFVSVHVNASANTKASGTETFVLGVDKNNDNLGVAMRENGVISMESNFSTTYEGYDPNSSESLIMFTLMQYAYTQESLVLADLMQRGYDSMKARNRGVKQAGFLVLWRTSMPCVLTELGFLSNAEDREYLTSPSGQKKLAQSLANSVLAYVSNNKKVDAPVVASATHHTPAPAPKPPTKPAAKPAAKKPAPVAKNANRYAAYGVSLDPNPSVPVHTPTHYAVQLRASSSPVPITPQNFASLTGLVRQRKVGHLYKYTVGELSSYADAAQMLQRVKRHFPDAFTTAYDHTGQQITLQRAKEILGR